MSQLVRGKNVILSVYDEDGTAWNPVACLTTNDINYTREINESEPNKCDTSITKTPGSATYEITAAGSIISSDDSEYGDKANDSVLFDLFWEGEEIQWKIDGGNDEKYGFGYFINYSETYPTQGFADFSLTISGNDKPVDTDPNA